MNKYVEIETTFDDLKNMETVMKNLLEKRLVACCQVSEVSSAYHWNGKIESAKEYLLRAKTKKALYNKVQDEILRLHAYKTSQIICIDIDNGSKEYLDWIEKETI